jgi:hypothetical protein
MNIISSKMHVVTGSGKITCNSDSKFVLPMVKYAVKRHIRDMFLNLGRQVADM